MDDNLFRTSFYPFSLTHERNELLTGLYTDEHRQKLGGDALKIESLEGIFDVLDTSIACDADLLSSKGQGHISPLARLHPTAVVDTSQGPVLIDDHVTIEAFCYIKGPVAIGKGSTIRSGARLYGPVVIGPVCKVGGELQAVVMHGYSNKAHDGFLGHSWIGSWCNLGAGTTTSNIKNTYGPISIRMPWGQVRPTGRMFLGTLMGDHTKTAIGTLLTTGTVIGISTNIVTASIAPSTMGSFLWNVQKSTRFTLDRAITAASAMMARRSLQLTDRQIQRLREIYDDPTL
jgi:UDP-N-acetylglucosamine diphosphorylase/glucosamine-1-phosphate N-acetyltransferase